MRILIDNLDSAGPVDYTEALDLEQPPRVVRRLNRPTELRCFLLADYPQFVVPAEGGRVRVEGANNAALFTGYVAAPPEYEYLGWGECGPVYRYSVVALSDEALLDRKLLPPRAPFTGRTAGDILRQLANDLLPGSFDLSGVQDVATLPTYSSDPQLTWSEHAAAVGLRARAAYRAFDGRITLAPLGAAVHPISEAAADFSPGSLKLRARRRVANDLTVTGRMEPRQYVKDYFLGDGLTLYFNLSHSPFTRYGSTLVDEEYHEALRPQYWTEADPAGVISVSGGKLVVNGGGADGQNTVCFAEKLELGGALVLQHGEVSFTAASDGVIGGLYADALSVAGCFAGFRITPSGSQSQIRALVNGAATGSTITTVANHRYALTTRLYASHIYRRQQTFHSSLHPAGSGRGGAALAADVRVVLEVHDIDPANPGSLAAPSTVLYDAVAAAAPDYCTYALINAVNLRCNLSFTRLRRLSDAEVRSALPGQSYRTRLVGFLADGAACDLSDSELRFLPEYVPVLNEKIAVRYRSRGRAMARVTDPAGIAALARGDDDGVRGAVRRVETPAPRTAVDCENAALALLDDSTQAPWSGEYRAWSDVLPADIFPGDAVAVSAPSRQADFTAIVREVEAETVDPGSDRLRCRIAFANDAAEPTAFEFQIAHLDEPLDVTATTTGGAGAAFIADLPAAEVTEITSTTVTIDAGANPPAGGGFEVRRGDGAWGLENDRNLVGRYTARTFTVTRLSRLQTYYLRQYDASSPPRYSRYSTCLHLDYPL